MTLIVARLKRGKTEASDGVLAEFLQAMTPEQIGNLYTRLFEVLAGETTAPASWYEASITLIPKIERAVLAADFRPITRLPVLKSLP